MPSSTRPTTFLRSRSSTCPLSQNWTSTQKLIRWDCFFLWSSNFIYRLPMASSTRPNPFYKVNPWLAAHVNCRLPYADSVAPDQPAHPRSLIWELHCPLICRKGFHWLISGQCSSQIRLRGCAGWSGATLSAYGRRQMTSAASQGLSVTWYIQCTSLNWACEVSRQSLNYFLKLLMDNVL